MSSQMKWILGAVFIVLFCALGWQLLTGGPEPVDPGTTSKQAVTTSTPPVQDDSPVSMNAFDPVEPSAGPAGLWGRVYDEHGEPLADATVMVYESTRGGKKFTTGADGIYQFPDIELMSYRVTADHDAYNEAAREGVDLGDSPIDFTLAPLSMVSGIVVDAYTDEPIPNAEVLSLTTIPEDDRSWRSILRLPNTDWHRVDEQTGSFELADIPSGVQVAVAARAEGYGVAHSTIGPLSSGQSKSDVVLRLPKGGQIAGTVVDERGDPVANAAIYLDEPDTILDVARTDASGAFEVSVDGSDPVRVFAVHPKFVTGDAWVTPIESRKVEASIVLASGGTVTGKVYLDGDVVSGASVDTFALGDQLRTKTNDAGEYELHGVPGERVQISVSFYSKQINDHLTLAREIDLSRGDAIADFFFTHDHSQLDGHVTYNGTPAEGALVMVRVESEYGIRSDSVVTDRNGYYNAKKLLPGTANLNLSIELEDGGEVSRKATMQISEGTVHTYDFHIESFVGLSGTITGWREGMHASLIVLPEGTEVDVDSMEEIYNAYEQNVATLDIDQADFAVSGLDPGKYVLMMAFMPNDVDSGAVVENMRYVFEEFEFVLDTPTYITIQAPID